MWAMVELESLLKRMFLFMNSFENETNKIKLYILLFNQTLFICVIITY